MRVEAHKAPFLLDVAEVFAEACAERIQSCGFREAGGIGRESEEDGDGRVGWRGRRRRDHHVIQGLMRVHIFRAMGSVRARTRELEWRDGGAVEMRW